MTVRVNPLPELTVQKANDINCNTPSTQLRASGALQYTWSPATGLDNPDIANPVSTADSSIIYLLEGTNEFGCTASTEIPVAVTKDGIPRFVVPNAFTPNGDGNNDCFGIKRWGNARIEEFSVFNRWGQLVFKTNTPSQCWDGRFNGKPQDTGAYVYIIKAKTLCGEITRKGMVMLVR
jgi:gliding motility-associated-like protein